MGFLKKQKTVLPMGLQFGVTGLPIQLHWAATGQNPSHTRQNSVRNSPSRSSSAASQAAADSRARFLLQIPNPSSFSPSLGRFTHSVKQYSLGVRRFDQGELGTRGGGEMPTLTKLYSMKEAALHNTPDDCWIVVDGKIYDVTKYLEDHPGGADVLLEVTGKDGTEEFEDAGHSKDAKKLMQDYFIGELDLDETPEIPEMEVFRKEQDMDFGSKLVAYAVQYWAIPVAAVGISAVVVILYARKK